MFSGSRNPTVLSGILCDVTGSQKPKMAASNLEIRISRLVDMIATKLQRLPPCYRGQAIQLDRRECLYGQPLQDVLKFLCRFFRCFVISSFLSCHFSAYCLCLFWFLLFASFKVSSFHFYSYFSGILCLFPLMSLIR